MLCNVATKRWVVWDVCVYVCVYDCLHSFSLTLINSLYFHAMLIVLQVAHLNSGSRHTVSYSAYDAKSHM